MVTDEVTGLLVEPGDPAALAAGIQRLLGDSGLRERLGSTGPEIVEERFTLDRMVEETLAVYAEVLGA